MSLAWVTDIHLSFLDASGIAAFCARIVATGAAGLIGGEGITTLSRASPATMSSAARADVRRVRSATRRAQCAWNSSPATQFSKPGAVRSVPPLTELSSPLAVFLSPPLTEL